MWGDHDVLSAAVLGVVVGCGLLLIGRLSGVM